MARYIGALAKQVGLSTKAIRYYEGLGLLAPPQRSESGYRLYGEEDAGRLRFIQGAKALGLSLAEIQAVLSAWGQGEKPCRHVTQLLQGKLAEVDRRIEELQRFREALAAYVATGPAPGDEALPCRHVAGAARGDWTGVPPEAILAPHHPKGHRA